MSYNRPYRGGGRRRNRDDYEQLDRRRDIVESPEQKLRAAITKLGEVDVVEELPRLAKQIHTESTTVLTSSISEAFRIAVTEQPFKIPHYATLMRLLHDPTETDAPLDVPSLGRQVLEDFWKGFQAYLDKLAWREIRLCIHFFAHLTMAKLISPESMFSLLQSFTTVLDEFGVSHGRAKRAALCAAEGLMMAGPVLKQTSASQVADIINAIQTYNEMTSSPRWIVLPMVNLHSNATSLENANELLETLLTALKMFDESDFAETFNSFHQPYRNFQELPLSHTAFDLPSVLVPPEVIEVDGLSTDDGEDAQVKKEEWPEYFMRLFDNEITPDPSSPSGYAVRTALLDMIDVFEVNRKECARLMLELPKWTLRGTFKSRPGAPANEEPVPGKDWQLESTILEVILGALLVLPESSHRAIYYMCLITELCKLSPSTVGPAVGKSIRKLYGSLGDGLDVEVARRFAEWFAVHMSNFGFQWVWKEWLPDIALCIQHPRRAFIRRAVEFEIRLAYYDRIVKTLPPQMQEPSAYTLPEKAPGPEFEYDDAEHMHHDAAQSVLNLFRGRAKADDVIAHLDTLRSSLESSDTVNVDGMVRSIVVQSLLHIGSRSFSHLLNAIERYLPLLRNLSSSGGSTGISSNSEARADILTAVAAFWKFNRQMVGIVFDKLMQYQIVDPTDVIDWTFLNGTSIGDSAELATPLSVSAFEWDLMKGALDKANGRVITARRKVAMLRKEDDESRARANARVDTMEVDADAKQDEPPAPENPALITALKAFASLTREQKSTLSHTLEGFVSCLAPLSSDSNPNPVVRQVVSENEWHNRANWDKEQWNAWETWSWYRHFCRTYSPYLRNYATTLYTISFSRFEGSTDSAVELMIKTWNIATGQEA